jgi:hypothetical protein
MAAIDWLCVPPAAGAGVGDIGEGDVGDALSLQPTTVNARNAIERKPADFFMTLSLTCRNLFSVTCAAPGNPRRPSANSY